MLTDRERAILALVAQGKRDKEIARIINVGYHGVNQSVHRVMRKLGVHTRAAVVAILVRKDEI